MLKPLHDIAKRFISGRRAAYQRVFDPESRDARLVLADLARFCRATETTVTKDPILTATLEGRREAWLRIQQHLNLSEPELWRLVSGYGPDPEG